MSMISEQVKELREMADYWKSNGFEPQNALRKAADTIEALSEKLAEENKKQSSRYCGEEKQLIEAMAEEIENCYSRETELSERARDYLDKTDYDGGWIPCSERLPKNDNYILLSFENFSVPLVGRYESNEDGGVFYVGDETESCISQDIIVNAWQPLPESYKGEEEE